MMLQCICKLCNTLWMLQCTCLWCNAMDDFTSTHKSQERKWGLQSHCYISTCVAVPVLTAPIWLWFLHMHIQYKSANVWLQCMNFYTSKIYNFKSNATSGKTYKFTNKAKFRSYLASVSFWNLMEAIEITKLKRVNHIATFTCLHRRSRTWAKHGPKVHHLFTNISQHQNKHTSK